MTERETVALVLAAWGFACLGLGAWLFFNARHFRRWTSATAWIVKAERRHPEPGRGEPLVEIHYRYHAGDRGYVGTAVKPGQRLDQISPRTADRLIERYPLGAEVLIHYDPQNPENSCLEPRGDVTPFVFAVGLLILVSSRFV